MFEYSALQVGQIVQSSSKKLTGSPQKSQGMPSSKLSKLMARVLGRGVAEAFENSSSGAMVVRYTRALSGELVAEGLQRSWA
jgi:hypothetical protein